MPSADSFIPFSIQSPSRLPLSSRGEMEASRGKLYYFPFIVQGLPLLPAE